MQLNGIRNILFDLGGVLLDIDYNKTEQAFRDLGFDNFDHMYSQFRADALFEKLETGHVTIDDFYTKLKERASRELTDEQLNKAWCAMILDFRKESLAYLKILSQRYRVYLLSNTNEIHIAALEKQYAEQLGAGWLDDYFHKAYYSSRIGLRKPHKECYEFVLADAGIRAEETLFIDDSYNNIEAAAIVGLSTHLLLPEERIETLGL